MSLKFSTLSAVLVTVCLSVASILEAHDTTTTVTPPANPQMEVVFVLDTTGSMSGMIAGAKQKIWAIANKLKSAQPTPVIKFGLVGYRDRGDAYVTQVSGLNENIDEVYTQLYAFEAQGGGDEPESVNEALHKAVRDMQWSEDPKVLRVIFLVGDARPHMDYQDDVSYLDSCKLANRKGILINTLQCGKLRGTEEVWREIAAQTNGTYAAILQSGGSVKIATPYDDLIIQINVQLDATIVPYGSKAEQASAVRNKSVLKSLAAEAVADRSSYFSKGESGSVMTGKGDLVVELMNGRQKITTIDPEQLAPELQKMPLEERNALITQKVSERRALQDELNELIAKRDAMVAEKLKAMEGQEGVLELNAFEVLENQAEAKGFVF